MSSNNNPRYTSLRIVVGISAQVVKFRVDEETIKKLLENEWWNGSEEDMGIVKKIELIYCNISYEIISVQFNRYMSVMDRLTETYAFLGHYKEKLGNKNTSILQLFVPIVEMSIYMHMQENNLQEIQGMAISEIRERIKSSSGLEIPVPVIASILCELESKINDKSLFKIYLDNSFMIQFNALTNRESLMKESEKDLSILELHFENYCQLHSTHVEFSELVRFVSMSQLGMFTGEIGNIEEYPLAELNQRIFNPSNRFVINKIDIL